MVVAILTILVLLAIATNPFLWIPIKKAKRTVNDGGEGTNLPPLSVIIMLNDNADVLERNIKLYASQDYPEDYQIILVANEGDADADALMKRNKDVKGLQYTFIPKTSRYVSREKLGVTLGVKAAKYEWCILSDALSYPRTNNWLREMGKACTKDKNLVIGYSNYDRESHQYQRFARLKHFAMLWLQGKDGIAYSAAGSNLAFRKSEFIKGDGYRGNLDVIRGELDFIVNKYATKGKTAFVTSKDGTLLETAPYSKLWHRRQLFYIHSCKNMKRTVRHRIWPVSYVTLMYLAWTVGTALGVYAGITKDWYLLSAAVASVIILASTTCYATARCSRFFKAGIPVTTAVWLELTAIWHIVADRLRYSMANKYDFTCHKL